MSQNIAASEFFIPDVLGTEVYGVLANVKCFI